MEKFYIITNDMKDANRKITVKIKKCIESYGKKCYLEEQPEEGNFSKIKIPKDIDCVLTVGGDGTFIQASRRLFGRDLPMLGINMGTLGYLTEVEVQNVEEAVKQLVEGNYTISARFFTCKFCNILSPVYCSSSFLIFSISRIVSSTVRTAHMIVSSPAIQPTISFQFIASSAAATAIAIPDTVFSTRMF